MEETKEQLRGEFSPVLARLSYTLSETEIRTAVRTAYYLRALTLRLVQSAALIIILAMYIQAVMVEPTYTIGILMAVVSAGILITVWLMPMLQAKSAADRAAKRRFAYDLALYDKAIVVQESERSASRVLYDDTHLIDTADFFILLCDRGRGLYCIPKHAVEEEELTLVTTHLHSRCEKVTKQRVGRTVS